MDPTDTAEDRWEVTSASHTVNCSYYLVICEASNEAVKVIVAGKKRRYAWNDLSRKKEEVPPPVRRGIDRGLLRYLTSNK